MTDVFISYASEDRERARNLARALEARGWSVWWDRKIIPGQAFDEVIEHELEPAKCVIVLWSKDSIFSEWVKNEAAAERGVLVPALIDDVKLPLEFRRKQTADLIGWDGTPSAEGSQALCDGVAATAHITGAAQPQLPTPRRRGFRWHRRWTLGTTTAITIAGLIIILIQAGVFDRTADKRPVVDAKQRESASAPSVDELESQLKVANIKLLIGAEESELLQVSSRRPKEGGIPVVQTFLCVGDLLASVGLRPRVSSRSASG